MIQFITPDYFRTLGVPLLRGRLFTTRDRTGEAEVTIINEALARKLWSEYPHFDPIGQRLLMGAHTPHYDIVGVVANIHQSLENETPGRACPGRSIRQSRQP